ncbi:MAG: UvrD-helicase domain-containing protein [Collinsella sp.]
MDLSTLMPQQRDIVTTLERPLFVSAGAGSGKTFTLTRRILWALSPESGPFIRNLDQVLAITFTKDAAAEIRERDAAGPSSRRAWATSPCRSTTRGSRRSTVCARASCAPMRSSSASTRIQRFGRVRLRPAYGPGSRCRDCAGARRLARAAGVVRAVR